MEIISSRLAGSHMSVNLPDRVCNHICFVSFVIWLFKYWWIEIKSDGARYNDYVVEVSVMII